MRTEICWAVSVVFIVAVVGAVGCNDGTVVARGHIKIEGNPAGGGRLALSPVGGGKHAFSLVTEDGEFALRTSAGAVGVEPGSYRISYYRPLDRATLAIMARELRGQLSADEFSETYVGPNDKPLVIPANGADDIVIDIRTVDGWTRDVSD